MSHTPGPWQWDGEVRADGDVDALVDASGDAVVCGAWRNDSTAGVWVHPDNAHLIAAAPELLEALKQLKSRVEELSAVRREGITGAAYDVITASIGDDLTAEFIEAEEAIAKAEGRTP